MACAQDDETAALHKQLKELGFENQVIKAVLVQESSSSINLDQAIDLCLGHNEFQVAAIFTAPIACMRAQPLQSAHHMLRYMCVHTC